MKPAFGIVLAALVFTSAHAGNSLKGANSKHSASDLTSGSKESWNFSWDASGSTEGCDAICPKTYEPVCGSDGVTYTNDCAFSIALCRTSSLKVSTVGECAGGSVAPSAESSKDGSAATACPDACIDVYDPVSDESGKTYSNECYMRMAKCKDTKEDVDILAEYKRLYGRSFGASRDDDAGDDSTKAPTKSDKSTKNTKSTKSIKSTKTSSTSASGIGSLYEDGSDGVIGSGSSSSTKNCTGSCPDIYSPVCGSDGVTYSSACHLELASCKSPKLKIVQTSEDVCAGSASTTQQETVSKKASKSTKTTTA